MISVDEESTVRIWLVETTGEKKLQFCFFKKYPSRRVAEIYFRIENNLLPSLRIIVKLGGQVC